MEFKGSIAVGRHRTVPDETATLPPCVSIPKTWTSCAKTVIPVRLSVLKADGAPALASLWFEPHEDALWCAVQDDAFIARCLRGDARCAFEVAGDLPPYRGLRGPALRDRRSRRGQSGARPTSRPLSRQQQRRAARLALVALRLRGRAAPRPRAHHALELQRPNAGQRPGASSVEPHARSWSSLDIDASPSLPSPHVHDPSAAGLSARRVSCTEPSSVAPTARTCVAASVESVCVRMR